MASGGDMCLQPPEKVVQLSVPIMGTALSSPLPTKALGASPLCSHLCQLLKYTQCLSLKIPEPAPTLTVHWGGLEGETLRSQYAQGRWLVGF